MLQDLRQDDAFRKRCAKRLSAIMEQCGKKGLKLEPRWDATRTGEEKALTNLLRDMGRPLSANYTIGRRRLDKGYDKSNCRWVATAKALKSPFPVVSDKVPPIIRILGMDPGTVNNAFCKAVFDGKKKVMTSLELGFIQNPFRNLKEGPDDVGKTLVPQMEQGGIMFINELRVLMGGFKPHYIITERFQSRPGAGTKTSELVNMMHGMVFILAQQGGVAVRYPLASSWKNWCKTSFELEELYKWAHKTYKLPPHPVDALMMVAYELHRRGIVDKVSFVLAKRWIKMAMK